MDLAEVIEQLAFNDQGLIPAITQDVKTKEVLMMAWMNKDAFLETLSGGYVTYWSRSRNELWVKGATSGHTQKLISLSIDCDGDTVLCQVEQTGAACHTGRKHCFYLKADPLRQNVVIDSTYPNP
ncbi:MAG: phosphoribosyl-AMP cyclohydrolase [Acidiferrobacterales bacterium]|nr:phosphoribosyl-AMP cyclohydrolase [Acidiferrobacterales bacterium]